MGDRSERGGLEGLSTDLQWEATEPFVLERLRHGMWEFPAAKVSPLFTTGPLSIAGAYTHSPWSKGSCDTEVKILQVQILI